MKIQNIKTMLILILIILCPAAIYGQRIVIHIAPILYVDEINEGIEAPEYQKILYSLFNGIETGRDIEFRMTKADTNPPLSIAEAIRLSQNEGAGYLLYGFVAKREYTYYCEIKLFDMQKRDVIYFGYTTDGHGYESRLINDIARNLLEYCNETFSLNLVEKQGVYSELWIPIGIGYWLPLEKPWTDLIMGTGWAGLGIEIIPLTTLFVLKGKGFYLSTFIGADYRYGLGNPDRIEAHFHDISLKIPELRLYLKINNQNHIGIGSGLLYTFSLLNMTMPYEDNEFKLYRTLGVSGILSYRLNIKPNWQIYLDNVFEARFYERVMMSYSPRLGVNIRALSREVRHK
ncbi:MAG: hypothetical protein FWH35_00860 [Treponema sp.]|nr:hypothetical protein [Treponema sp.]